MTSITDSNVITASGGLVEVARVTRTNGSSGINITATSVASASDFFSTPATFIADGSSYVVEVFIPLYYAMNGANYSSRLSLVSGSTEITRLTTQDTGIVFTGSSQFAKYIVTPSPGVVSYNVRAWVSANNSYIFCGNAGSDYPPAFLRVSKIVQATQWPAVTTGTIVCTSTTRPSSPFVGQQIYEADTVENYIWNGSVWASSQTVSKPPMCINERTGQSISDSVTTAIAFTSAASVDTETPTTIHSTSTNNTRFTARTAGVYQFYGSVVNSGATIDVVASIALRKNGTTDFANSSIVSNAYTQNASVSGLVSLAVGDYVELTVYQDNTANQARTFTGRMQCALVGQAS